jgi:hypothetical protein
MHRAIDDDRRRFLSIAAAVRQRVERTLEDILRFLGHASIR